MVSWCILPATARYLVVERIRGDRNETPAPNVNNFNMHLPSARSNPRVLTLSNGNEVRWCGACTNWGKYYRAECIGKSTPPSVKVTALSRNALSTSTTNGRNNNNDGISTGDNEYTGWVGDSNAKSVGNGNFTRLCATGLLWDVHPISQSAIIGRRVVDKTIIDQIDHRRDTGACGDI